MIDHRLGAEDLQWKIFQALADHLSDAIAVEEARGHAIDAAFRSTTGRRLLDVTLDRIKMDNFHMGHRPSLIEAPVSEWPALAVSTYSSTASSINADLDQQEANRLLVSIEFIVHSGPFTIDATGGVDGDGEEIVDRRAKRTAEAVHAVLVGCRELDGYHYPGGPPVVTWGEVFIREGSPDGTDREGRFFWQGVRLQYTYEKASMLWYDVDQS